MKTEQEQIKAIKQIIDERVETNLGQVQGRHDNVIKTVDTVIIARDIIKAGYGDVSEYKAEIERLTHIIEYCENEELVKSKVKQAQIDVLNELKARSIGCSFLGEKLITESEIDELIKEVQNEQKD